MMLDVSYIGNRGSRLNHHCADAGRRREHERSERARARDARCCSRTSTRTLARQRRHHARRIRASTATSRRRCGSIPQYQTIHWRGVPTGGSQYHAIELVLERRFSRGLQARFGYTYSKLNNNGAESAQGMEGHQRRRAEPGRSARMAAERGRYAARVPDRLHVGGPGHDRWTIPVTKIAARRLEHRGILRYESGRPLNITMANDLGGLLFNGQKRPNRVGGVDRRDRDRQLRSEHRSLLRSGRRGRDPGPLQFGNAPQARRRRCAGSRSTART